MEKSVCMSLLLEDFIAVIHHRYLNSSPAAIPKQPLQLKETDCLYPQLGARCTNVGTL